MDSSLIASRVPRVAWEVCGLAADVGNCLIDSNVVFLNLVIFLVEGIGTICFPLLWGVPAIFLPFPEWLSWDVFMAPMHCCFFGDNNFFFFDLTVFVVCCFPQSCSLILKVLCPAMHIPNCPPCLVTCDVFGGVRSSCTPMPSSGVMFWVVSSCVHYRLPMMFGCYQWEELVQCCWQLQKCDICGAFLWWVTVFISPLQQAKMDRIAKNMILKSHSAGKWPKNAVQFWLDKIAQVCIFWLAKTHMCGILIRKSARCVYFNR